MQASVRYGEHDLPYEVRVQTHRTQRRIAIHVEPDGRVMVDAPGNTSAPLIHQAVKARARWIYLHVAAAKERLHHVLARDYVSGESLLYLGRRYRLKVTLAEGQPMAVAMRGAFIEVTVPTPDPLGVRAGLQAWYRQRARSVMTERVQHMAESLQWVKGEPALRLLTMRSQWGSCSPAGRLTLNPHLVKAPRQCIDYVVLHELCHLREHNHSARFYALLDQHLPDWRRIKARLDGLADFLLNE